MGLLVIHLIFSVGFDNDNVSVEEISHPKMIDFRVNAIEESDGEVDHDIHDEYDSNVIDEVDGHDSISEHYGTYSSYVSKIKSSPAEKQKRQKKKKTRMSREISDKELNQTNQFDSRTQERRFIQLKFNKMGEKLYNEEIAKDYRILKSNLNRKVLDGKSQSFNIRHQFKTCSQQRKSC